MNEKNDPEVVDDSIVSMIQGDNRLSMKAKGIMYCLLTKPSGWKMNVNDLIRSSTDGRDSIDSGIKELEAFGYLPMGKNKADT